MRGTHDPKVLERIEAGYKRATDELERCMRCGLWKRRRTCERCRLNQHADTVKVLTILYPLGPEYHRRLRGKAGLRQRTQRRLHGDRAETGWRRSP